MSVSNIQVPSLISAVYDPMFYMNDSTYSDETNFRYRYDIHDKDGLIITKYVLPFPSTYGRIDVSPILKPFLSYDFNYDITGCTSCSNSIIQYDTYIGYSALIHNLTPASTGIKYCINATDDNFNFEDFIMDGDGRFLTNSPKTINVYKDDYYTLSYLNGIFNTYVSYAYRLLITYSGRTEYITLEDYEYYPGSSLVDVGPMLKCVGVGPKNLGITDESYTVCLVDSGSTIMSEIITFNLIDETNRYGEYQLAFLNRLGAFSYFTFTMKQLKDVRIERNNYEKNKYSLDDDGLWSYDQRSGGLTTYSNSTQIEYTFNSQPLDQETYDFMEELFTSPMVYWIRDGVPVPITITDTTWSNKKKINDKVIFFSLKAVESYSKKVML